MKEKLSEIAEPQKMNNKLFLLIKKYCYYKIIYVIYNRML